jgi:hypothetical protein
LRFIATNIYAVGNGRTLSHFDGTAWTTVPTEMTSGRNSLQRINGSAADNIYAVGQGGALWHYTGR